MNEPMNEKITIEDLGRAGYKLYQSEDCFRFGTDTVLLAWFAASFIRQCEQSVPCGQRSVLELGAGNGAASFLVAARRCNTLIDSVEILAKSYDLLVRNIALNGLEERVRGFCCDIRELPSEVNRNQYDVVMFNPPFFAKGTGPCVNRSNIVGARSEENGTLDDFVRVAASRVIQSKGRICLIMQASRLMDVLSSFDRYNVKVTDIMAVHPFADTKAKMVLVAGRKGAKGTDVRILPPLILNERKDGQAVRTRMLEHIYEEEHTDCFIW